MSQIYKDYYELQEKYKQCQEAINDAIGYIICVGGPLNDDVLNYNNHQLKTFWNIKSTLESVIEKSNDW